MTFVFVVVSIIGSTVIQIIAAILIKNRTHSLIVGTIFQIAYVLWIWESLGGV